MPQLAVDTYCSQIFWVLLGFLAVYLFVSKVVTGGVEGIFKQRSSYVDGLNSDTDNINSEAKKLEDDSAAALEDAEIASAERESALIASFREQSFLEKDRLYNDFARKSRLASAKLSKEASDSFVEISKDLGVLAGAAISSINRYAGKKVRGMR